MGRFCFFRRKKKYYGFMCIDPIYELKVKQEIKKKVKKASISRGQSLNSYSYLS